MCIIDALYGSIFSPSKLHFCLNQYITGLNILNISHANLIQFILLDSAALSFPPGNYE